MRFQTSSLLALLFLVPLPVVGQENFGSFEGTVKAEWLIEQGPDRQMLLLDVFSYKDPSGNIWGVPKGSVVNGASIPMPLWSIVGDPYTGDYRNASVVHDYYCGVKTRPWKEVHRMFYSAMRAGGVGPVKAKLMYAAVYRFGPRWKDVKVSQIEKLGATESVISSYEIQATWRESYDEKSFSSVKKWIEETNPSLEEIEVQDSKVKTKTNEPPSVILSPIKR